MIGLALEGGADRCAFTAGVVDALMQHQFYAAAASGTSAGAGCVLNYRSKQQGISRQMMLMQNEKPYFGIRHLLQTGRFLSLNEMASQYAEHLNFSDYFRFPMQTDCVATCCENGEPAYLTGSNAAGTLQAFQASCALPMICTPIEIDGKHYVDGSIADPIPFQHLLEQGCHKVIVVLTGHTACQPTDYRKFRPLSSVAYGKRYPALHHALLHRIARYQEQITQMQQAQKAGKVFVIQPEVPSIPLFTRDTKKIDRYYQHGCELTERIWPTLETWLSAENLPKSHCTFLF